MGIGRSAGVARRAPLAALVLLLAACFDLRAPVEERLLLTFSTDGTLGVRLSVELRHPESDKRTALVERLERLERELLAGFDPWPRRFDEAAAAGESFYWEKREGRLVYLERNLVLEDPAELEAVLADTPVQSVFRVDDGVAELALYPGLATRASRRERRQMAEVVETWGEALETYFRSAEDLYRYLDLMPHRAVLCFAEIFEIEGEHGELTPEEEALVEAYGDAAGEVLAVLDVDADRGASLDELSHRVYDPFPALLEVAVPAPATDVDGFVRAGERWAVPGLGLWSALALLEGVWLSPDPLLAWVAHERANPDADFDVASFAARGRTASSPTAAEVRDRLEAALTPADVYRVAWRMDDATP